MIHKAIICDINNIKVGGRAVKEVFKIQLKLSWYQFKIDCYNFWMLYVICLVATNMYTVYTKGNEKEIKICHTQKSGNDKGSQ